MNNQRQPIIEQSVAPRVNIEMRFAFEFEALLLHIDTNHDSLSADIEEAALCGLQKLQEFEDVHDISPSRQLMQLIQQTDSLEHINSEQLMPPWTIAINEELLHEIDQILLIHKESLVECGLKEPSHGNLLVLLALAGSDVLKPESQTKGSRHLNVKFPQLLVRLFAKDPDEKPSDSRP